MGQKLFLDSERVDCQMQLRTQMKTQCSENKILSGVTPGSETGKGARQLLKEPACPGLHGLVLH